MMSNMEAEAIRMMKAKNGSYATVEPASSSSSAAPAARKNMRCCLMTSQTQMTM